MNFWQDSKQNEVIEGVVGSMRIYTIIFSILLFLSLILVVSSTYSAIKARDADLIKVAYMNGYVQGIRLDDAEVKKLRKDESLLRKAVETAADDYLKKINSMNKSEGF